MYEVKCDKCLTPQMSSDGACKVCGTPRGTAAQADDPSQIGTRSFFVPADQPVFFPVSKLKFTVMQLTTFGLYEVFWAFKCWVYVQSVRGKKIAPGWRAWFSVFYMLPLLKEIHSISDEMKVPASFSPKSVFIPWLLLTICWKLPSALWLISFFSFVPLFPVLSHIESMNRAADKERLINRQFSVGNIIWIVIGSILLVLSVIGSFLPDTTP